MWRLQKSGWSKYVKPSVPLPPSAESNAEDKIGKGDGAVVDDEEAEEEEDIEVLLEELEELLYEADSMPIYIEESVGLRAQLSVIQWGRRYANSLPMDQYYQSSDTDTREGTTDDLGDSASCEAKTNMMENMTQTKVPTYQQLQSMIKELNKVKTMLPSAVRKQILKANIPAHYKHSNPIRDCIIPEEIVARKLLDSVDSWFTSVKRLLGPKSVLKPGAKVSTIRGLVYKAKHLHVNVQKECQPLSTALEQAEAWTKKYEDQLKVVLYIHKDELSQPNADNITSFSNRLRPVWSFDQPGMDTGTHKIKIEMNDLESLHKSAQNEMICKFFLVYVLKFSSHMMVYLYTRTYSYYILCFVCR